MFSARQAGQGQKGLEQALQAGLDPHQLGGRPAAQPGQLLLDVAHQLPRIARELLPHRVGRLDQEPEGRDQAAVHAGVEEQGQRPPVGRDLGARRRPGFGMAPGIRGRRGLGHGTGTGSSRDAEPAGSGWGGISSSSGSDTGSNPDTVPSAGSRTWSDSAPPSIPTAEGLVEPGQDRADEPDDQFGVLGGATEDEQLGGHPSGQWGRGSADHRGPHRRTGGAEPRALLERRLGRGHPGVLAGAVAPARDDQRVGIGTHPGQPAGQEPVAVVPAVVECSSATAKVRRTAGRGSRAPVSVTVGAVDGSMISWPTQSPGRARIRSRRSASPPADKVEAATGRLGRRRAGPGAG